MKRCDTPLIFNLEHMLNTQLKPEEGAASVIGSSYWNDLMCADTVHPNDSHFISKMNLHFFFFVFFLFNKAGGSYANLRE